MFEKLNLNLIDLMIQIIKANICVTNSANEIGIRVALDSTAK